MPSTFSKVAPTPSWVTVSASGLMSIVAGQVPAIGYQGTARISVTDGFATATIDIPINIAARVDGAGQSLYETDFIRTHSIAWKGDIGAVWTSTRRKADLNLVWPATIGAIFGNQAITPATYDDDLDLNQSIADAYSDGTIIESVDLSQSIDMAIDPLATILGSVDLSQSIVTVQSALSAISEAALLTGLTYSQSSLYSGLSAASQSSMTDGAETMTGTNNSTEWIECSFSSRSVRGVRVGGGNNTTWGGSISTYLNGATLQAWNGSAWVDLLVISGVADSGASQFLAIYFALVSTTKIRLYRAGNYLSTSELYPIETTATTESALLTGLTYSQSSLYSGLSAASLSTMTDSAETMTGTNNSTEWIECSFSSQFVSGVRVGGGNNTTWGGSISTYLNSATLQSWNGSAWVDLLIVSGVADSGGNQFLTIYFALVQTTKIRLYRAGNYLSTSELYPITLS
jgi:hypothetical protein